MNSRMIRTSLMVIFLLVAGTTFAKDKILGKGVTLDEVTLVSELLADPESYVGKVVRIEGPAVAVCKHRGCWVNIGSDKEGDVVRFKVKDGEIVFQPEMLGDKIVAQGVWTSNQLDLETTKKMCEHNAKQEGKKFNPDEVTECMTLYQLNGTGAMVVKSVTGKSTLEKQGH